MTDAPPKQTASGGYLRPGQWVPIVAFLAIVVAVLSVMVAVGLGGGGSTEVVIQECKAGEPSCELRQIVHEHADFAVILNGEPYDFSDPRFVVEDSDNPRENIHIHAPRFTLVHVHREQSTWDENSSRLSVGNSRTPVSPRPMTRSIALPAQSP